MTRAYIKYYMEKAKYSESKVVLGLQEDLVKAHKAYTSWKKKQPKPEAFQNVESVILPRTEDIAQTTHYDVADAFLATLEVK